MAKADEILKTIEEATKGLSLTEIKELYEDITSELDARIAGIELDLVMDQIK